MNNPPFILDNHLSIEQVNDLVVGNRKVVLAEAALQRVRASRAYLERKIATSDRPIYGVNTGFGSLCDTLIPDADLALLQMNLLRSHACGTGDFVPEEIVRIMLLLKVLGLIQGYSGVQVDTVIRLLDFFNAHISPVVYTQGSLGASGDLAPLAHLCLPLIGEGEVWYQGSRISGEMMLQKMQWTPITLGAKEGLALINGTQFMTAYAVHTLSRAKRLGIWADAIATLSLEAFDGRPDAFHPGIHRIRPHQGQVAVAQRINYWLSESKHAEEPKKQVQDPYSLRCIPQIHGASWDALNHAWQVIELEINAVSDNPNVLSEEELVISGGNFHGQPLALVLDYLALALAEWASVSERRLYLLISGQRGLPAFLTPKAGLHSGFMIVQYAAASVVSLNKQLASPASVDSIVSSNGQEDHVSMGANAAWKTFRILCNAENVLGMELLAATQALEFKKPIQIASPLAKIWEDLRTHIPFIQEDTMMQPHMEKAANFIRSREL